MAEMLWKRLFPNDFNAINGNAAPGGGGGGAMHIVLGTNKPQNDVRAFLRLTANEGRTIPTEGWPGHHPSGTLTFALNPARNDEWRIADQVNHRHPAWAQAAGFPSVYDATDPPVIVVVRFGDAYHVRWLKQSVLQTLDPALAPHERGVASASPALLLDLSIPPGIAGAIPGPAAGPAEEFDPKSAADGRKRILAAIVRRQGQGLFRAAVVDCYEGRCVVTGCSTLAVLEAAHISPYRGPETNHASNGLLFRADIHTLFDLALLTVDPKTMQVCVSSKVTEPAYAALTGTKVRLGKVKPSGAALAEHFAGFLP